MYFVTICCEARGTNQICHESPANVLFETARRYHASQRCYVCLLLLMPDHLHGLISIGLIRDFKRITARLARVPWQTNFFDHRLRHDESLEAKAPHSRQPSARRIGWFGGRMDFFARIC